ncbi:hypothetical protein QE152_g27219 [Popillia japonica]|uniref:Uncharacterized protein n=1 Tax=Popillia japonica TaxID=7064 RepID=A0AAW1JU07_POPJA
MKETLLPTVTFHGTFTSKQRAPRKYDIKVCAKGRHRYNATVMIISSRDNTTTKRTMMTGSFARLPRKRNCQPTHLLRASRARYERDSWLGTASCSFKRGREVTQQHLDKTVGTLRRRVLCRIVSKRRRGGGTYRDGCRREVGWR